jgi:hypothetical protein
VTPKEQAKSSRKFGNFLDAFENPKKMLERQHYPE